MVQHIESYAKKIKEAEFITGLKKSKIGAYTAFISKVDEIFATPGADLTTTEMLKLNIQKFEYMESLAAEESALEIQEKYLEEDKAQYDNMIKKREKYMEEIEAGEYEKAMEKLKLKIADIKRKTQGKGDTTKLVNLLTNASGATTIQEQVGFYEQLKIHTSSNIQTSK